MEADRREQADNERPRILVYVMPREPNGYVIIAVIIGVLLSGYGMFGLNSPFLLSSQYSQCQMAHIGEMLEKACSMKTPIFWNTNDDLNGSFIFNYPVDLLPRDHSIYATLISREFDQPFVEYVYCCHIIAMCARISCPVSDPFN